MPDFERYGTWLLRLAIGQLAGSAQIIGPADHYVYCAGGEKKEAETGRKVGGIPLT